MTQETFIADVRGWCARNAARYRMLGADEEAEALTDLTAAWIAQQGQTEPGTLEDLRALKVAVRLGGVLLEFAQESHPKALEGWRLGQANNCSQRYYEMIYSLTMELGFAVAMIEREYPEMAQRFALERADYAKRCADLKAQHAFEIAHDKPTWAVTAERSS